MARKKLDTQEMHVGQDRTVQIALEGPAQIEADDIEVVEGPKLMDQAELASFMEEVLKIMIHPSHEPRPERMVYVGVDGRACYIPRSQPCLVKRKYVERLARARVETITQDVYAERPEDVNRLTVSASLRYPFVVMEDPNPKGSAWLQKILAEA